MKPRLFVFHGTAAAGLAILLSWVAYRHGRILTFDAYYYCELSKQFTSNLPDRFGNHWPFGYPLLGALLGRMGISAYFSLCCISIISLVALGIVTARMLYSDSKPWGFLPVFAICATPIVAVQAFGILSELPFAAAYLALVVSIASWPSSRSIILSGILAIVCLTVRYVGVLAFVLLGISIITSWYTLRSERKLRATASCIVASGLFAVLLLSTNVIRTGHLSGADRSGSPGIGALGTQLADFGWSAPSALLAGGLRDRINPTSPAGRVIGTVSIIAILGLCTIAWRTPRSQFSRTLALSVVVYAIGISLLRCFGSFDELWNVRTFLPILAPTTILLFERIEQRPMLSRAIAVALIISGGVSAVRGISRQIGGDVVPAANVLKPLLTASDAVAINDHALTLSAYLRQPVRREPRGDERYFVFATKPTDRMGTPGVPTPDILHALNDMLASGNWRTLLESKSLVVLQRAQAKP